MGRGLSIHLHRKMKRANNLIAQVSDPDNLRLACWKAATGKRHTQAVMEYSKSLDSNLMRLRAQILSGLVEVGNYRRFKIFEPKERPICAPAFNEQVLHHALMNVCHEFFEQKQVFDSFASRVGKGTHAALERAKAHTRHHGWFLKLDVRKFFDSIHHVVLKKQLRQMFKDVLLLRIFEKIIDSYEVFPERGVPIGNLTSQYFANHYLSGLDIFIQDELHIGAYVRYMDDLVLWHKDKGALKDAYRAIGEFAGDKLQIEFKPELLNRSALGLPFLGYRVFPQKLRLTHQSQQRFFRKFRILDEKYNTGEWDETTAQRHALPLFNFVKQADTFAMRQKLFAGSDLPSF